MPSTVENQALKRRWAAGAALLIAVGLHGCGAPAKTVHVAGLSGSFAPGQILSAAEHKPVTFEAMLTDLSEVRVVYVGETHTNPVHHAVQLQVIEALYKVHPDLVVGMEMFDHTYQEILDQWSAGAMTEDAFLKKTHWYANWRYDFSLYRDILQFVRRSSLRLVALNIPFHIPPKIAAGGLDSLGREDREHLPHHVDTSDPEHRAYVEKIFTRHHIRGQSNFEAFYQAQCVWEDAMAESVASASRQAHMVVLVGNGHIIRKFGIPNRVYKRTGQPFRTIYPLSAGGDADLDLADYLWVTP